jgi:hypothetical protein
MVIGLATSADAWAIARVHVLSWQTGYRRLVSDSILDNLSIEEIAEENASWLLSVPVFTRISTRP